MARRAIPMIAFHGGESIIIYLYVCGHLCEYALYTLLRKLHHSGGLGQLIGVVCKRTHARTSSTDHRKKAV